MPHLLCLTHFFDSLIVIVRSMEKSFCNPDTLIKFTSYVNISCWYMHIILYIYIYVCVCACVCLIVQYLKNIILQPLMHKGVRIGLIIH